MPRCLHSVLCKVATVVAALCVSAGSAAPADCQALTNKTFGFARIVETSEIGGPVMVTSLDAASQRGVPIKAAFCRVRGMITPTPSSDIRFEVWLPRPEVWNGRYQGIGNGGNAGTPQYPAMARALESGYATSGTDTGHVGTPFESRYAIDQPEKVVDFGWRAVHETAVAAKKILNEYYGRPTTRSYFNGCSTGGRQGLVEAQRFADDYDGIVVGAPANDWPRQNAVGAQFFKMLATDPQNWVSPEKLAMVNRASVAACKGVNGLVDAPGECRFDLSSLLYKAGQTDSCLTDKELRSVRSLYQSGIPPGAEAVWSLWKFGPSDRRVTGALSYSFNTGFFRDLVFQNPQWDVKDFNFDVDLARAQNGPVGQRCLPKIRT